MFYEAELRLLRDTFRKCRIQTCIADPAAPANTLPNWLLGEFLPSDTAAKPIRAVLPGVQPATIYRISDSLDCHYIYLLLPELPGDSLLILGPYLSRLPSQQQLLEQAEKHNIPPVKQQILESYYTNIPVLPQASHLFVLLNSFAERLWGSNGFTVEDVNRDVFSGIPALAKAQFPSDEEDALWNMQNMELRYAYENEMMMAVANGQLNRADVLLANFSSFKFEQRLADPVRNAKNYCIIMNTLLRKAAENGGVHPIYLDSTSSTFATKIEQLGSTDAVAELMSEMFRTYCRLVRKHSMKHYSPTVQKAVICIDSNLGGNLSLSTVATRLNVSNSYLSTLFKKETGQTLTEYINQRRIKYAMHLLKTTRLQVQTVAQHCGIMDIQYFSKVFKRIVGMTPKEYRERL